MLRPTPDQSRLLILIGAAFVLLAGLKLAGLIGASWWAVCVMPLLLPLTLNLVALAVIGALFVLAFLVMWLLDRAG